MLVARIELASKGFRGPCSTIELHELTEDNLAAFLVHVKCFLRLVTIHVGQEGPERQEKTPQCMERRESPRDIAREEH